ncbi:hypothetical protein GSI_12586 [Ganoderma sinense ZZ0214-1]|uniref:Uncharacterized protein n=1 Tax=Ganoderma sinense ZZ0214-1 TaxID=1077348 RepID=A0A2G8RT63_9APHY|nr:hypothetical protein GSI_12586 [Ganoderma sinense ZZ0214-1]
MEREVARDGVQATPPHSPNAVPTSIHSAPPQSALPAPPQTALPAPPLAALPAPPLTALPVPPALPTPLDAVAQPSRPKRRLAGKLAHQMDNVKAPRVDEFQKNPPHVRVTEDYELSFQDGRTLPKDDASGEPQRKVAIHTFDGIEGVPAYNGFWVESSLQRELDKHNKSTSQSVRKDPIYALQGVTAALAKTVSWIWPSPSPQPRIVPASREVLNLLKLMRQHERGEADLISDEEANAMWFEITDEERFNVLQMYSKCTAKAQIAASEAAFKSLPTNHILAPQNLTAWPAPQPTRVSQHPFAVTQGLNHPGGSTIDTGSHQQPLRTELANPPDVGAGGSSPGGSRASAESSSAGTSLPPEPSQVSTGSSAQGPSMPQDPPPENWHLGCDDPMSDDGPDASNGNVQAAPQVAQTQPSTDRQPMGSNINVLPFDNDHFAFEHEREDLSTPYQDKGKARAVDHMDTSGEAHYMPPESPLVHPPPSLPPAAYEQPTPAGPTPAPQAGTGLGDQSGNLTGGIIALLFNELRTLNANVRENSKLQREAIDAILGLQSDNVQSTTPPGSPGPSKSSQKNSRRTRTPVQTVRERKLNNPSLRARKKQKRVTERVSRWQGEEGETSTDEELVESDDFTRLKARVRNLLRSMLGIDDWAHSAALFPTLTQEQIDEFDEGKLECSAQKFFIDFDHSWAKFKPNRVARQVFLDHYFARVTGGAYAKNPTPEHLLTREVVGRVLDKHMPYCRRLWRESKRPLSKVKKDVIKARAAKNSRKSSIHLARSIVVRRHGDLCHVQMWLLLEPGNMDGDEPEGGQKKKFPVVFNILRPKWASQELCNYWWSLDAEYRTHYGNPTHERATRGNPPRDRVLPENSVEDGVVPFGLWRNCYDQEWLESLQPHLRQELEIIAEDFDFKFAVEPTSRAATTS